MDADQTAGGWSFRIVRADSGRPRDDERQDAERTFRDVIDYYLANLATRARPETQRQARGALERMAKGLALQSLDELTADRIAEWRMGRLTAGASNRTANHEVSILSAALNLAVKRRHIDGNPLAALEKLPTTPGFRRRFARALCDDEIKRLLAAAREIDKRWPFPRTPTLRALLVTAARWNELTRATWADLDVGAVQIVLRAVNTKNSKERRVPLSFSELRAILALREDHVRVCGDLPTAGDRIFLSATGKPWGRWTSTFHDFLREAMRIADVPYKDSSGRVLHVHALRHTCATRWADHGMSLLEMQRLLGHSDPKLTSEIYVGLQRDIGRAVISSLPPLDD